MGGTSEEAPAAVRQAVGGGCQSDCGRLLSVTNAIEVGTWRQGDGGRRLDALGASPPPSNASRGGGGCSGKDEGGGGGLTLGGVDLFRPERPTNRGRTLRAGGGGGGGRASNDRDRHFHRVPQAPDHQTLCMSARHTTSPGGRRSTTCCHNDTTHGAPWGMCVQATNPLTLPRTELKLQLMGHPLCPSARCCARVPHANTHTHPVWQPLSFDPIQRSNTASVRP